jgi:hypothetical protein
MGGAPLEDVVGARVRVAERRPPGRSLSAPRRERERGVLGKENKGREGWGRRRVWAHTVAEKTCVEAVIA